MLQILSGSNLNDNVSFYSIKQNASCLMLNKQMISYFKQNQDLHISWKLLDGIYDIP